MSRLTMTGATLSPEVGQEFLHQTVPRRILVVDDNVDGVWSLSLLLRYEGHDIRTAYNGFTAIEIARQWRPEIVLLDVGLPGLNGLEVARRIRHELGLRKVLLIAMTGYGQDSDRQRSHEAGFNAHLVKPLDWETLTTLLAHPEAAEE